MLWLRGTGQQGVHFVNKQKRVTYSQSFVYEPKHDEGQMDELVGEPGVEKHSAGGPDSA